MVNQQRGRHERKASFPVCRVKNYSSARQRCTAGENPAAALHFNCQKMTVNDTEKGKRRTGGGGRGIGGRRGGKEEGSRNWRYKKRGSGRRGKGGKKGQTHHQQLPPKLKTTAIKSYVAIREVAKYSSPPHLSLSFSVTHTHMHAHTHTGGPKKEIVKGEKRRGGHGERHQKRSGGIRSERVYYALFVRRTCRIRDNKC